MSLIDDYSRILRCIKSRRILMCFLVFKEFQAQVELKTMKKIKCFRTNNGGEYVNGKFLAS